MKRISIILCFIWAFSSFGYAKSQSLDEQMNHLHQHCCENWNSCPRWFGLRTQPPYGESRAEADARERREAEAARRQAIKKQQRISSRKSYCSANKQRYEQWESRSEAQKEADKAAELLRKQAQSERERLAAEQARQQLIARQEAERQQRELARRERLAREEIERKRRIAEENRRLADYENRSKMLTEVLSESNEAIDVNKSIDKKLNKAVEETSKNENTHSYAVCSQTLPGKWICDGPAQLLWVGEKKLSTALRLVDCQNADRLLDIEGDQFKRGCGFAFQCSNAQTKADRDIVGTWGLSASYDQSPPSPTPQVCMALGANGETHGVQLRSDVSKGGTGYYGFRNGSSAQDRETKLKSIVGSFSRVGARGDSFEELCEGIGMKCKHAVDWEGNRQDCKSNGRDGSRLAFCQGAITYRAGFYGFKNSSAQDREAELKRNVGSFERLASEAGDFAGLCRSIGLSCKTVKDWEGANKSCVANGHDGSRVAHCVEP